MARLGKVGPDMVGLGSARQGRDLNHHAARQGEARRGRARPGAARRGPARQGKDLKSPYGTARHGAARPGGARSGVAWQGRVLKTANMWRGGAGLGAAGRG